MTRSTSRSTTSTSPARWSRPATLIPGVLFVHGWGGSQEQYVARAREIAALGCICLTFDLRGHAKTRAQVETVTREDNLRDVLAAYDALLHQRGVDAVGDRRGRQQLRRLPRGDPDVAALGALARAARAGAATRTRTGRCRRASCASTRSWTPGGRLVVTPGESRALAACAAFKGDVLVVESEHDDDRPAPRSSPTTAPRSRRRRRSPCASSRSADHSLSTDAMQQAYTAVLVAWLKEMIGRARKDSQTTPVIATPAAAPAD